jgi:transposase-like protein
VILVALGVDSQGRKHVLALREGTTENATVCKALLADVRERGLDLERTVLFVIDGGTGLRKAIRETCGPTAIDAPRLSVVGHRFHEADGTFSLRTPASPRHIDDENLQVYQPSR